jgi:hypothetical protein
MRLRLAILVLLLAVGCASGASKPGPNDGSSLSFVSVATFVIDDTGIRPDFSQHRAGIAITVTVGDVLTVTNRGTKDHGLTSDSIETGTLRPGESTTVLFTEAGIIDAYDRADPSHTARIEVLPANSP